MILPRATYRLQLRSGGVDLDAARTLVPWLDRLGVSHLYLSPVARARRGSSHGYDVVDPDRVDPALGGEQALARLAEALHERRMGLLLDWVPNHAAAHEENPRFDDVLAHGPASRFAPWFDVDWGDAGGRHARLMLPVLAEAPSRVLASGALRVVRRRGRLRLTLGERSFPLDPATLPGALEGAHEALRRAAGAGGDAARLEARLRELAGLPPRRAGDRRSRDRRAARAEAAQEALAGLLARRAPVREAVDRALARLRGAPLRRLLARQAWRLEDWRRARHVLNYRRFFDINDLVALRCEDPVVFAESHAGVLGWIERGWVDGLRIDHVDGLLDPAGYLRRLRRAVDARRRPGPGGFLLVVEKILARGEPLPPWPVDGTTGYDFLNEVEAVLLDPEGVRRLRAFTAELTGRGQGFGPVAREAKRLAVEELLGADLERAATALERELPPAERRGPSPAELRAAIREAVVHLPVYRTYATRRRGLGRDESAMVTDALAAARREGRAPARALARVAEHWRRPAPEASAREASAASAAGRAPVFVERLQQLSGPAAAKGVEDTAFYRYVPLLSLTEVGGEPDAPLEHAVAELHAANRSRARRWPRGLLSVSTHDTKRSADVRSRLDVLSEMPEAWQGAVARWRRWNARHASRRGRRVAPDPLTELRLYQTLVGAWPLPRGGRSAESQVGGSWLPELRERVMESARKSAREAKLETGWTDPDAFFEEALERFVTAILSPTESEAFLRDLARFVRRVARPGLWNSLSRTLLQLTSPGVPDLYQGDSLWRFALVDPDNRRPVEFGRRARLLDEVQRALRAGPEKRALHLRELARTPEDGRIKLAVIHAALEARRRHPRLFCEGDYTAVAARGPDAERVVAFARRDAGAVALVAVARRLRGRMGESEEMPTGPLLGGDTFLRLPSWLAGRRLTCALTGRRAVIPDATAPELALGAAWSPLPVALLVGGRQGG